MCITIIFYKLFALVGFILVVVVDVAVAVNYISCEAICMCVCWCVCMCGTKADLVFFSFSLFSCFLQCSVAVCSASSCVINVFLRLRDFNYNSFLSSGFFILFNLIFAIFLLFFFFFLVGFVDISYIFFAFSFGFFFVFFFVKLNMVPFSLNKF